MIPHEPQKKRLFALRGAAQSENNCSDIAKQSLNVYDELLSRNNLAEEDIVSVHFSLTRDLDAKNPAQALREQGRAEKTALFVTQEAYIQGGLERVIRLLIHCYLDESQSPVHVYRNGAEQLRPELST